MSDLTLHYDDETSEGAEHQEDESIHWNVLPRQESHSFQNYLTQLAEAEPGHYLIQGESWQEGVHWKDFKPGPLPSSINDDENEKVLVFRDCEFHSEFLIELCDLQFLSLRFERCQFHGPFLGGQRAPRGKQESTYGSLVFHHCHFLNEFTLKRSTLKYLEFSQVISEGRRLYFKETNLKDVEFNFTTCRQLDFSDAKLAGSIAILAEDDSIHEIKLARAKELQSNQSNQEEVGTEQEAPTVRIEGYTLQRLALDHAILPGYSIEISACNVKRVVAGNETERESVHHSTLGSISFEDCEVSYLSLGSATLHGSLNLQAVGELKNLFLQGATLHGGLTLSDVSGEFEVNTSQAEIHGKLYGNSLTCNTWNSEGLECHSPVFFEYTDFQGECDFTNLQCHDSATWERCHFHENVWFNHASMRAASFGGSRKATTFGGEAHFEDATMVSSNFYECEFLQEANFAGSTFGTVSKGSHDFRKTHFKALANFEKITLHSTLQFGNSQSLPAIFEGPFSLEVKATQANSKKRIDISMLNARFENGARWKTNVRKVRLLLQRAHAQSPEIRGEFHTINLNDAVLDGRSDSELLQNWKRGKLHLHNAVISNTLLHFDSQFTKAKKFDKITMFAREASFKSVRFTGHFIGDWRFLACKLTNVEFVNLSLDADLDLSRCTIRQDKTVTAFSNIRFFDRRAMLYKQGRRPRLQLNQCDFLENLQFADGCELEELNLRGSELYGCEMREGRCARLLVRQGMQGTISLQLHPSSFPSFRKAYKIITEGPQATLSAEQEETVLFHEEDELWRQWAERELNKLFRFTDKNDGQPQEMKVVLFDPNEPFDDANEEELELDEDSIELDSVEFAAQDIVDTAPTIEPSIDSKASRFSSFPVTQRAKQEETAASQKGLVSQVTTSSLQEVMEARGEQLKQDSPGSEDFFDGILEVEENSGSPTVTLNDESISPEAHHKLTSPSHFVEEECHVFFVGLWNQEEKNDDAHQEGQTDWVELDLSRHTTSPLQYIKRELVHHFRSTQINNWRLIDFEIKNSDRIQARNARPVFRKVYMEGSTIKGRLFDCVIVEQEFVAESACAFENCDWRESEFRGPVTFSSSNVLGHLTTTDCRFEQPVQLTKMTVQGEIRFPKSRFRSTLSLLDNQVTGNWYFKDTEFMGPVLIEGEKNSGGLSFLQSEFNDSVQFRKSNWKGEIDLSSSFFARECLFKEVTAGSLKASSTEKEKPTQFKGPLSLRDVKLGTHSIWGHARFAGPLTLEDVSATNFVSFLGCEFNQNVLVQRMSREPALSFIRSFFAERLLIEDPNGLQNIFVGRTTCHGPVIIRGTLTPQDDLPVESLPANSLHTITFSEAQCTAQVSLENLSIESTVDLRRTLFTQDLTLQNITFHGEIQATGRLRRHKICGEIRMDEVEVHNALSLRELHRCIVLLDKTHVRDELDIRSFSRKRPLHCSLSDASITTITFPDDPIESIGFAQPLPEEVEEPKKLPTLCQQKAQHYSQLYQLSLQRKQYDEAREFRYHYRKALKGLSFVQRYQYLRSMRENEERVATTSSQPSQPSKIATHHRLAGNVEAEKFPVRKRRQRWLQNFAALWESLIIQFGHTYDGYGRSPLKVLIWLLMFNSLSVCHGFFGWGIEKLGVVWLDTLLTPIGFLFQGMGLRPFGSTFPSMPQQIVFYTHTILVGLMWLYFLRLLIPGLVARDKISQMLSKRTGGV